MIDVGGQISWPSSALPYLTSDISEISITFSESAWLASIDSLSVILGVLIYPLLMDIIGRKYTILVFAIIQVIAWILINFSTTFIYLCLSRAIVGIGYAGTANVFAIYIGEIAEKNIRGMFLSLDKICVCLGGFIVNSIGAFVTYKTMNLIMISIPLAGLGALSFMHETPYFYLLKKQDDNAIKTLMKLNDKPSEMVLEDIERMKKTIEDCRSSKRIAVYELIADKGSRRGFYIKLITDFTYAFSGFIAIQTYAQNIFEYSGFSLRPAYSTMLISGVQSFFGFFSSYLVDKWGRKCTYLLSGILSGICLIFMGFFFFCKFYLKIDVSLFSWLPLVSLTIFQIVCTTGLATVPYIYSGELFSVKVKGVAVMLSAIFIAFCLFASKIMLSFLGVVIGFYTIFWLFAAVCFIGPIWIFFYAPETKGKNLEEVLEILHSK